MHLHDRGSAGHRSSTSVLAAALGCTLALFWPALAHAYVDPGSGSAIVTAILGAIGAIGYTLRKFFYRVVKKRLARQDKKDDGS